MNESNYLTDPTLFKEYFNALNEAQEVDNTYKSKHIDSNKGLGVSMANR